MLCAFGAEVIKVETKIGDEMRRAGEFEMVVCEDDKNPLFTIQNSGQRLTSIDLKNPDGKAAMLKLLETADVFLTNVRLPSLGRLGLDYETLHKAYPGLVFSERKASRSATGFVLKMALSRVTTSTTKSVSCSASRLAARGSSASSPCRAYSWRSSAKRAPAWARS